MNISTVNELIQSLESAGELSIRETKVMAMAKAFKQLAAENVAIREQSEEVYAAGYNHGHLNTVDGIAYADCVKDDFYGLALQVMAEAETPATDRIVAGIKADGVEEFAEYQRAITEEWACKEGHSSLLRVAESAELFAKQLREGKSEEVKS
ncbi:hypothetical protein N5J30_10885 [Klebsiella michiganensis]|uniref:hypothetical protein n=1 Tax=Klebsiella michiganensis TaxID=1134687 RepID=UPI001C8B61DD|nr:hypothetical protein [Klebsiella michiganensis]MBX8656950.1 hypothetical protein [Klebsiella michiganensis]MDH1971152.1 hypothetical protein [Klebsiella michiganensis]HED2740298.1 hypothetical protein [Klebsiella michiganensis]HED2790226.1 hypothetical protein [Klebsiella michiganensis]HED2798113.1 hypothetical protein [Klebsiella michiganensis]